MEKAKTDGRQVRWQEHNLQRRQAIVDAAISVLESQSPGDDLQVQVVADRAGVSRTVIYRHFGDRADLDRAVQREICDQLGMLMLGALAIDGTPDELVRRVTSELVHWAAQHTAQFWFIDRDIVDWGPSPIAEAIEQIAAGIEEIINNVIGALGGHLTRTDMAGIEPWVFAMIGGAFGGIRRWLGRPIRTPSAQEFSEQMAEVIWLQINGMAHSRGINLPDMPIGALLQPLSGVE